ncbi:MAG: copper amine oxidase N-terminal domain-containing protein [Armatimonadota bacterium]
MKRVFPLVLAALVLTGGIVWAQAKVVVKEYVTVLVDRVAVRTDVPPINVEGRTLVPARPIFAALGAEVDWFPEEKHVVIQKNGDIIQLHIGESEAQIDDQVVPLDVSARIYRGRTMVPLRFVAEALGATVEYNPDTDTITIISNPQGATNP